MFANVANTVLVSFGTKKLIVEYSTTMIVFNSSVSNFTDGILISYKQVYA